MYTNQLSDLIRKSLWSKKSELQDPEKEQLFLIEGLFCFPVKSDHIKLFTFSIICVKIHELIFSCLELSFELAKFYISFPLPKD